jgi:hypothetical protein
MRFAGFFMKSGNLFIVRIRRDYDFVDFSETLMGAFFVFASLPVALAFLRAHAAFIASLIALLTAALLALGFAGIGFFAAAAFLVAHILRILAL